MIKKYSAQNITKYLLIIVLLLVFICTIAACNNENSKTQEEGLNTVLSGSEIFNKINPSVVFVSVKASDNLYYSGTGFFINNSGRFITNYHVIEDGVSASIMTSTGSIYNVTNIVGYDENLDIAIIDTDCSLSTPVTIEYTTPNQGEKVYAIGYPAAGNLGVDVSESIITEGIISATNRVINGKSYIQTSVDITHGNSGGPLINEYGKVIGITSGGIKDTTYMNLAIPSSKIKQVSLDVNKTLVDIVNESKVFTVTFKANGIDYKIQNVEYKKCATKPINPTSKDYVFKDWYIDSACKSVYDFSTPIIYNTVVYAGWYENPVVNMILYENEKEQKTIKYNNKFFEVDDPIRNGYKFEGWYQDSKFEQEYTFNQILTSSISIYAKWSLIDYTITYNLNDGSLLESNPVTYNVETETFSLNNPTKEYYDFTGWVGTGINGIEKDIIIEKGSFGNRQYTARYNYSIYNISYDLDGGSIKYINPDTYKYSDNSITLNNPSKNGYTFAGWSGTEIDGKSLSVTIPSGSSGDRTYKANWEIANYSIQYELNGGDNSSTNPSTYTINDAITLSAPTKNSYEFIGWSGDDISGTSLEVTISKGSTGDRTYSANWSPISYSITYNLNGGTNSEDNPESYTIENSISLIEPIKEGYDFTGWSGDDIEGTTKAVSISKGSTGDRTYTANWKISSYSITYVLDSGTNDPINPKTYTIDDKIVLSEPTKDGYEFIGWSGDGLEGNVKSVTISKGNTGNKTYTANWKIVNYSITYELNGGTNNYLNLSTYTILDNITLDNPSRIVSTSYDALLKNGNYSVTVKEYTFEGWYKESTFDTKVTSISGTGNVIVYAKWSNDSSSSSKEYAYKIDGNNLYFGLYPQTKVTDGTITSALNVQAGTPTVSDSQSWTSYGYYKNGIVSNDMWYIDVEYNNCLYRGVYYNSFRTKDTTSSEIGKQSDNGYPQITKHWFKYEPIKWNILENENGVATIICDIAIDSQPFDNNIAGTKQVDYEDSFIRSWLNSTFYDLAFNDLQKAIINTSLIDETLNDKVYLLSEDELRSYVDNGLLMTKKTSDYCNCQGCNINSYVDNKCDYWLRTISDYDYDTAYARYYSCSNSFADSKVTLTMVGVVPVIKIVLNG